MTPHNRPGTPSWGWRRRDVKLPGGQKQRVVIARVIMRQPTFLLLDEATSALDALNERTVQRSLDSMLTKHRGIALVVAHRLTTICNCDNIVVMGNNGRSVEQGVWWLGVWLRMSLRMWCARSLFIHV